jgi:large subunit ribosomal protein L30
MSMGNVRIILRRSLAGQQHKPREAARSLGLRKIGQAVVRPESPRLAGVLRRIGHLVEVRAEGAAQ